MNHIVDRLAVRSHFTAGRPAAAAGACAVDGDQGAAAPGGRVKQWALLAAAAEEERACGVVTCKP